jgi:hypothetical protein
MAEKGRQALIKAGYPDPDILTAVVISACDNDIFPDPSILDGVGFVEVTCVEPGNFQLSFADARSDLPVDRPDPTTASLKIVCKGSPAENSVFTAFPGVLEIVPAMGSVSHSLITVTLLDEEGKPPESDYDVDFSVDRCSVETSGVDTADELVIASGIFTNFKVNVPETATAIEESAAAQAEVDSQFSSDTMKSIDLGDPASSFAAAILGCNPQDAPGTTPGVATIKVIIHVEGDQDVVLSAQLRVVGPPAVLTATASPTSVRCGEKAEIKVTALDAVRQAVSNHTLVEAVTNLGGVLGGTGAVAGEAGPVVPLSSTVAETFDGIATFYLITSDFHTGPYEVVITTGGAGSVTTSLGGVFSTPAQVTQVSVVCTDPQPAPAGAAAAAPSSSGQAPAVTAPRTGGGFVVPPNTGDGGLADEQRSLVESGALPLAALAIVLTAGLALANWRRVRG